MKDDTVYTKLNERGKVVKISKSEYQRLTGKKNNGLLDGFTMKDLGF